MGGSAKDLSRYEDAKDKNGVKVGDWAYNNFVKHGGVFKLSRVCY